jgi:hypothetical protein
MAAPLTAGRRATLTFGLPFAVFFVGYGALALVNVFGLASYTDTATLTPQAQVLTVKSPEGAIRLLPSPDGKVHVTAKGHYTLQRPSLHTSSTSAGVTVKGSGCSPFGVLVCGQDITVELPPGFTDVATSSGGSVRASGLSGPLQLHSSADDIHVDGSTGALTLSTSAGDISATNLRSAQVSASSSAGDVSLRFVAVPDAVTANSSAGDVTVRVPGSVAYQVKTHQSVGDTKVTVRRDDASTHVITAGTSAGDVTVEPSS